MPPRAKYPEGTLFLVPLIPSGFALGVVARTDGKGRIFGHFFRPRLETPVLPTALNLNPAQSILMCRFGDHDLYTNKWPIVGKLSNWNRTVWSLPSFSRPHNDPSKIYITQYDDDLDLLSENLAVKSSVEGMTLVADALLGSGIVEVRLNQLLS